MAIDPTRGLPSFSEMYNAYKNQGSLGDSIKAGTEGFMSARAAKAKSDLEGANSREADAHARYYDAQATGGITKKVSAASLTDEVRNKLAAAGAIDADGNVSEASAKVAMQGSKQEGDANAMSEKLAHQQELFEQNKRHQADSLAMQQQLAELKAQVSGANTANNAATTIANTNKNAEPTLVEKLGGLAAKAVGKPQWVPDEVQRLDRFNAANDQLAGTAGMSHTAPSAQPVAPADAGVTPPTADMIANPPAPKRIFPAKGQGKGTESSPAPVKSKADYDKLPVGAWFVDATGKPTQKKAK